MSNICACSGCERRATHHIKAMVWAVGFPKTKGTAAKMIFALAFCKDHARAQQPEDVVDDEGWARIVSLFGTQRLMPPDRASIELEVVRGLPHISPLGARQ